MTINTENIQYKAQTADSVALKPLVASMNANNDQLPKNSLPVDTQGTIQSNAQEQVSAFAKTYNAHGILKSNNPNSLIGYA